MLPYPTDDMYIYIYSYTVWQQRPLIASSSSSAESPATIPFSVYEELVRECDRLHGENSQLHKVIDSMYDDDEGVLQDHDPSLVSRLQALIRLANERLRTLVPYRDRESQMLIQMIVDELQRIVGQM